MMQLGLDSFAYGYVTNIDYLYTYGGEKLRQVILADDTVTILATRTYMAGMEFVNDTLENIQHGDGRLLMIKNDTIPHYQYRIADHLGNTVVFFEDKDDDGFILDTADTTSEVLMKKLYYPFGMDLEGVMPSVTSPLNRYKYNGKEFGEETGLYFYGFRMYDASIGRFTGVDPISGQFAHVSVYNYAENEPVGHIDLWGLQAVIATDGRLLKYRVQKGQGPTQIAQDLNNLGYNVSWTSIVDNNNQYFSHISQSRYNKSNQAYRQLNMNEGNVLDFGFLTQQSKNSGVGNFSGTGADIYNEAARVINISDNQNSRDLVGVNSLNGAESSAITSTKSKLSAGFEQRGGNGIYTGHFVNESLGIPFHLTLQDGGKDKVGTAYKGIYGNLHRERLPNRQELANNPYAYTVNLPVATTRGNFILRMGFKNAADRDTFWNTATSQE